MTFFEFKYININNSILFINTIIMATTGVVDFENINAMKKKSVRGLLRKRAK